MALGLRLILEQISRTELNEAIERAALIHRPAAGYLDLLCNRYTAIRKFLLATRDRNKIARAAQHRLFER